MSGLSLVGEPPSVVTSFPLQTSDSFSPSSLGSFGIPIGGGGGGGGNSNSASVNFFGFSTNVSYSLHSLFFYVSFTHSFSLLSLLFPFSCLQFNNDFLPLSLPLPVLQSSSNPSVVTESMSSLKEITTEAILSHGLLNESKRNTSDQNLRGTQCTCNCYKKCVWG